MDMQRFPLGTDTDPTGRFPGLRRRLLQINGLARSRASKESLITFSGNIVSTALSVISIIIISRTLGPSNFGILAIYTSLVQMLLGLTDLGLGTTAIKLISSNFDHNRHYAQAVMKVIFRLELGLGLLLGVVGLLFARPIAELLGGANLTFVVQAAFFASIFSSAGAFIGPFFIAYQQFTKNALFGVAQTIVKVTGVLLLLKFASVELNNIIYLYTGIAIAGFFVGTALSPKGFAAPSESHDEKKALKEIFHFSKWILLSYIATVFAGRLDIFLLLHFKGSAEVGLYSAAQQLTGILPLLIGAFTTVLLPRVSRMTKKDEFKGYCKKVVLGSTVLTLLFLPILLFGGLFIHLIFGNKYSGSIGAFEILFIGYIAALFANPISLVIYAINKPKFLTYVNYGSLVISTITNIMLIPVLGMVGAAISFTVANSISLVIITYYTYKQIRKI